MLILELRATAVWAGTEFGLKVLINMIGFVPERTRMSACRAPAAWAPRSVFGARLGKVADHFQLHFVHKVDRGLLWLNLLFLLFITLVPFSTNLLAGRSDLHVPVVFYGVHLFIAFLDLARGTCTIP